MSVELIDKIKPKNNGNFPLVDAADVEMPDGSRLSAHNFLDASKLPAAVNDALAKAKASGEFDGKNGQDGKDGYTPVKGIDYFDGDPGPEGPTGSPGLPGRDGVDGKTPVKGEDYWTNADKQEIVGDVLASLPTWTGGSY